MKRVYSKKEYTSVIMDAGAILALEDAINIIIKECVLSGGSVKDAINVVAKLRDSIVVNLYSSTHLDKEEQFSVNTMINDTVISDNK